MVRKLHTSQNLIFTNCDISNTFFRLFVIWSPKQWSSNLQLHRPHAWAIDYTVSLGCGDLDTCFCSFVLLHSQLVWILFILDKNLEIKFPVLFSFCTLSLIIFLTYSSFLFLSILDGTVSNPFLFSTISTLNSGRKEMADWLSTLLFFFFWDRVLLCVLG